MAKTQEICFRQFVSVGDQKHLAAISDAGLHFFFFFLLQHSPVSRPPFSREPQKYMCASSGAARKCQKKYKYKVETRRNEKKIKPGCG